LKIENGKLGAVDKKLHKIAAEFLLSGGVKKPQE